MRCEKRLEQTGTEHRTHGSAFGFLVAGLGVGAALSILMAPRSGAETRSRIATKCLDEVEAANFKVREVRARVHQFVDEGQERVSAAVAAGREMLATAQTQPASEAM